LIVSTTPPFVFGPTLPPTNEPAGSLFLVRNYLPESKHSVTGESNWTVKDAILATSADPFYFAPYFDSSMRQFTHVPVSYSNPSSLAVEECTTQFGRHPSLLVSLGGGSPSVPITEKYSFHPMIAIEAGQTYKDTPTASKHFQTVVAELTSSERVHFVLDKRSKLEGFKYFRFSLTLENDIIDIHPLSPPEKKALENAVAAVSVLFTINET